MERPRFAAGSLATSFPSMMIRPPLTSSSPAMRRSSVDFPHPDGPTKTTKVPSSMSRSTPGMTVVLPKTLRTPSSLMLPMRPPGWPLFDCAESEAAHELALAQPPQHQDRSDGESRRGGKLGPEQAFRARIGRDEGGERCRLRCGEVECPEGFVPGEDHVEEDRGGDPGERDRRQHEHDLPRGADAVHAGRL